jgi:ATP/ADP translocase
MRKKIVGLVPVMVIFLIVVSILLNIYEQTKVRYVAAKWWSVCYVMWYERKDIKYKKLLNSLNECEEYIGWFIISE